MSWRAGVLEQMSAASLPRPAKTSWTFGTATCVCLVGLGKQEAVLMSRERQLLNTNG